MIKNNNFGVIYIFYIFYIFNKFTKYNLKII